MSRIERMKEIVKEYPDFGKRVGYKMCMVDELNKEYESEQIAAKGYCCPANIFNPELYNKPASEVCPYCEHYKKDCIIYGRKKGRF